MVSARAVITAFAAVVAVGSAAIPRPGTFEYYYPQASKSFLSTAGRVSYDEKICYDAGERAIGAPGYPAVPYMPCCTGKPPLPMDLKMESYSEKEHYGLWCGGTGKVVLEKGYCYKDGERAIGAPGKPMVDYMPCCDGREPQSKYGDWGLFCGLPEPYAPEPTVPEKEIPTKCAGDEGYPYVEYVSCGDGYKCARAPEYGWGFFCVPTGKSCYGPGVKGQGAKGYPVIDYMPCCDGQEMVSKYGEWGKFCPGKKVPTYEEPKPEYYKPYGAPDDYKPEPMPKGYAPPSYEPSYMPTPKPTYPTYYPSKDPKKPKVTTAAPKVTTAAPKVTTAAPKMTTAAPKVTTAAPKVTTAAPKVTTAAPTTTTAAPTTTEANALTEIFGEDFGCSETGTPAASSGGSVDPDAVATTSLEVDLPACSSGTLTQEDAEALAESVCSIARILDPQAECFIEIVPAVRQVNLENVLPVAVRQIGGVVRVIVVFFEEVDLSSFFASVADSFGTAVAPAQVANPTAEA